MKKTLAVLLMLCLFLTVSLLSAQAADESRSYDFRLTADGKKEKEAETGQLITATLTLSRLDSRESSLTRAVQAELEYDDSFLELVGSSVITPGGVSWNDMARRTGGRAFYVNYLSLSGGELWESETTLAVFQFRVLGKGGVSTVRAVNCLVSTEDGTDSYASVCNDLRIVVSTECTVSFEENGGSEVEDQPVRFGEKLRRPKDPKRAGYTFEGWYRDIDCTEPWDFENDTVDGNLTLYARWTEGGTAGSVWKGWLLAGLILPPLLLLFLLGSRKVRFDSRGGSRVAPVRIRKGAALSMPPAPVREGFRFGGWYTDPDCTCPWDFMTGKVEASMTLYALWKP